MGGRHDSLGRDEVDEGADFDHWRVNSSEQAGKRPRSTEATPAGLALLDAALGVSTSALGSLGFVGRHVGAAARPVVVAVLRPSFVPEVYQPWTWVAGLARHGERRRDSLLREFSKVLDALVPLVVTAALDRLDLTELVRERVDLEARVAGVDVDAVVAGVDLDAVVARVDLDAAASRLDVKAVLDRLDLTELVRERVDLDGLVAGVNIEAIIRRIDLVGLAEEVIAEVDLPEIIRESTGSVASDTIRGVRMQGISGDEALSRAVHRLRLRRGRRDTATMLPEPPSPAGPDGSPQQPGVTTRQP